MIQFLASRVDGSTIERHKLEATQDSMSNGKDQSFGSSNGGNRQDSERPSAGASRSPGAVPTEQQGWDAYRKWLSRVSMQPARRSAKDVSIYSWRGYNSWADKVRQSWKSDES